MSSDRMRLFWTFLDIRKFDDARTCIAEDFECNALHPEKHTTLLVAATASGLCKTTAEEEQCLELIKALRLRGASWTQACRSKSSQSMYKTNSDPESTKLLVNFGTHSALSFVQAWLKQFHGKEEWQSNVSFPTQGPSDLFTRDSTITEQASD